MRGEWYSKNVKRCQQSAMELLLLLPLFLLFPLSSSADLDLDYAREKSFSSSIVAPVQELHQLIIGEVRRILDSQKIVNTIPCMEYTKAQPYQCTLKQHQIPLPLNVKYSIQVLPCCGKKYQQRRLVNNRACIARSLYFENLFLELSIDLILLDLYIERETIP